MGTDITLLVNNHIKTPCLIRLCTKLPSDLIKKPFLYIIYIFFLFVIRSGKFDFGPVKLVFPLDRMSNESSDNFVKTELSIISKFNFVQY